ncbi:2-dehydro-3-deoxygalactonokinase [Thalassobaculum sp. OXR-137]|uniref:2-dehydro-3-deoxygalactonokinase n=1 Tax=Thalassobaculum sp. OXR-137 TaxID=3100173 RepID=UPI002AC95CDB|nr:2-dehydro-3-deoxygalactonokinase [Thalassobaculum sp. OXR-137]WPZ36238.1 2-dehydro-3-deoxygalactonokinase [Thalassobaculum sp. OXR-137]
MSAETVAIGIDWGTTSFRAFRFAADGAVEEGRRAPAGILAIDDGEFEDALEELVGDWLDAAPTVPVVLSGMIGSRQGWVETPYLPCPAAVDDIAGALVPLALARGRVIHVAPGLSQRAADGVPDVMRGEEVQILGAVDLLGADAATVCLPGTHSKWARVERRRVTGFATHMTGEVFDVLRRHSILGRGIEHAAWDDDAFLAGVERSGAEGGLLHHLFGVRAAGLFGDLTPERSGAFLSGLVIGHEIRAAAPVGPVHLIGEEELVRLYIAGLKALGHHGEPVAAQAAACGLFLIADSLRKGRHP